MTDAWATAPQGPYVQTAQTLTPAAPEGRKKSIEPAAITALALAVCSLVIWFIPAIVAIFLASGAKRNIRAYPESRKGNGMALAAQLVSVFSILVTAGIVALITLI